MWPSYIFKQVALKRAWHTEAGRKPGRWDGGGEREREIETVAEREEEERKRQGLRKK